MPEAAPKRKADSIHTAFHTALWITGYVTSPGLPRPVLAATAVKIRAF